MSILSAAANTVRKSTRSGISLVGAMGVIKDHPFLASAVAIGGYKAMTYSNTSTQSIPRGPATMGTNPGNTNTHKYDMGATGDLVFALHRLSS